MGMSFVFNACRGGEIQLKKKLVSPLFMGHQLYSQLHANYLHLH